MLNLHQIDLATTGVSEFPAGTSSASGNVIPTSVMAQAQAALEQFDSDALLEAAEDLGFVLGGRLSAQQRARNPNDSGVRGRIMMNKVVAEVAAIPHVELDTLFNGGGNWQQAYQQMLAAMQTGHLEAGSAAMQLAGWLAHGRPSLGVRSLMENTLSALLAEEGTALSLFGLLEFGSVTPALRQELVQLYQRTYATRQQLSQWLALLGERNNRKRKLRTMLRLLSFELSTSGQPIMGSHLAAVIGDLRQVLRILGLEAHCDQAATILAQPGIDGEKLMTLLIQLVEQLWLNPEMVEDMLPYQDPLERYHLLQSVGKLAQLLPDSCFSDKEHREQLENALMTLCDRIVG